MMFHSGFSGSQAVEGESDNQPIRWRVDDE